MLLILSDARDEHVRYLRPYLDLRGGRYRWIDPGDFPVRATAAVEYGRGGVARRAVRYGGEWLDLDAVTAVWYRRPLPPQIDPRVAEPDYQRCAREVSESCLIGLADLLEARWLPGTPRAVHAAQDKMHQLGLASRLGLTVPRTLVTNDPGEMLRFHESCEGEVVVKLLHVVHAITHADGEKRVMFTYPLRRRDLVNRRTLRYAPMTFQEYVPKRLELRVTVVGERVFAAAIDSQASRSTRHDWRHYDCDRAGYAAHTLPDAVAERSARLVAAYGLRFGAIDLILTPSGDYVFLELNPNGQWSFAQELTGLPIADAIADELLGAADGPQASSPEGARAVTV